MAGNGRKVAGTILLPILLLAGGWPGLGRSGPASPLLTPAAQVRETIERAMAVVNDPELGDAARRERLRQIVLPRLDVEEIAKRSLARHWRPNAHRMPEFLPLLADYLERAYVKGVLLTQAKGAWVAYLPEQRDQTDSEPRRELATVSIKFIAASGAEYPVGFRLHARGPEWKVYDVLVEGVSTVANLRSQFKDILSRKTFDELLELMAKRRAAEGKGAHDRR